MFRSAVLAALLAFAAPGSALADTLQFNGDASLSLSRNAGETYCWVERDCPEGEICHAIVQITGDPARQLADLLKARVAPDPQFADWGLEIYLSENDGLYCDLTEAGTPRCSFNFNPQTASMEGPLSCE